MISTGPDGVYIDVHLQPGARRSGVRGIHGRRLKISVTEPAEAGRANRAIVGEIAHVLGVRPGDVSVVSGARSRQKRLFVLGVSLDDARRLIEAALDGAT